MPERNNLCRSGFKVEVVQSGLNPHIGHTANGGWVSKDGSVIDANENEWIASATENFKRLVEQNSIVFGQGKTLLKSAHSSPHKPNAGFWINITNPQFLPVNREIVT